ncbi:MAG: arginine--tRNA ligase [Bacteroidales bacterium]
MEALLTKAIKEALKKLYNIESGEEIQLHKTRKEFKGDYTINVFTWIKQIRKDPIHVANEIGKFLKTNYSEFIQDYEVIKGFLNISLVQSHLINALNISFDELLKIESPNFRKQKIVIEFSSPNTNKPLHLGHIRNNLLGESISKILKSVGHEVIKVNLINDRGIHICKSMLAWQKWGNGSTPENTGKKGDKFVGDFYVLFDKEYKKQVHELIQQGYTKEEAEKKAPILLEAQEILRKWENEDREIRTLWQQMNEWVYKGFDETYHKLNIEFDKVYYESQTYQLGKKYIIEGLERGIFYKKADGSVWIDLTSDGLDEKLLLRSDGTSVYITQDIGTAILRYNEFKPDKMIYVVGNEQNYHFQVLKLILKKLGFEWADNIYHLSYGMVELPEGKMKSREGTVVDADDLIDELNNESKKISKELGKLENSTNEEFEESTKTIAMAALKYFILKVDPEKNMLFNPKESIDFDGNTGPFILYTYTRIKSLLNKAKALNINFDNVNILTQINEKENELIKQYLECKNIILDAAQKLSPAKIANYIYNICKEYNQFYQQVPILKEENEDIKKLRLKLSFQISILLKNMLEKLGISTIEKM